MASYDFDIKYKKGKTNSDADALSRAPHADPPSEQEDELCCLGAMSDTEAPIAKMVAQEEEGLKARIQIEQHKDPTIRSVINWIKGHRKKNIGALPSWYDKRKDKFRVSNDILYEMMHDDKLDETFWRVVVPPNMVADVLHRAHGDFYAGHPGRTRTLERLYRFCSWPNMRADSIKKVRSCPECQAIRKDACPPRKVVPVLPQRAEYPMHFVQADLLQLDITSNGFDHILVKIAIRNTLVFIP